MADITTLGSVIKTTYEAEADTNAFTDAEKTQLADLLENFLVDDTLDNIHIGPGAGNPGTVSGTGHVCIGDGAGAALTSAIRCVFIGRNSGSANTTGSDNFALGDGAMATHSGVGGRNTAIGQSSLLAYSGSGGANTGIGWNTLRLVTDGFQNTALGAGAGATITTGDQNICIGHENDVPDVAANGQIVIGNLFFGTGATGTQTTIPAGANAGIGVNDPSCRLEVDGPVRVGQYSVAGAPSASTAGAGANIYVSNGAAGDPVMAFSDGTNWLRCDTLAAISAS